MTEGVLRRKHLSSSAAHISDRHRITVERDTMLSKNGSRRKYRGKSKGPKIEPCGTPYDRGTEQDSEPTHIVLCGEK